MKNWKPGRLTRITIPGLLVCTTLIAFLVDRVMDAERERRDTIGQIEKDGGHVYIDLDAGFYFFESENVVAIDTSANQMGTRSSDPMRLESRFNSYDLIPFKRLSTITFCDFEIETDNGRLLNGDLKVCPLPPQWFAKETVVSLAFQPSSGDQPTLSKQPVVRKLPAIHLRSHLTGGSDGDAGLSKTSR